MRYIYIEFLGEQEGMRTHLVFDRLEQKEAIINHKEFIDDCETDFSWAGAFARMNKEVKDDK
jgi:hypothetical protein